MTQRLHYHYVAPNGVRFNIGLNLHDYPDLKTLQQATFTDLRDFLKILVCNSDLQHVDGPAEVRE